MSNALHKRIHVRRTCRKCGCRLVNKPEYGIVCPECGWIKKNDYTDRDEMPLPEPWKGEEE